MSSPPPFFDKNHEYLTHSHTGTVAILNGQHVFRGMVASTPGPLEPGIEASGIADTKHEIYVIHSPYAQIM